MKRTFEFSDDKSNKFWSIETNGSEFTVTFGKTGTKGQSQTKSFADEAVCQKEADKLICEKTNKGYLEEGTPKKLTFSQKLAAMNTAEMTEKQKQFYELAQRIGKFDGSANDNGHFSFYKNALKETVGVDNEQSLFNIAMENSAELEQYLILIFEAIKDKAQTSLRNIIWYNDEVQAGFYIASGFAARNVEGVDYLVQSVDFCDIDHEVDMYEEITEVWERWGCNRHTCRLLAGYAMQSQHGCELLEELNDELKNEEKANMFLEAICSWLHSGAKQAMISLRGKEDLEEQLQEVFMCAFELDEEEVEKPARTATKSFIKGVPPKSTELFKKFKKKSTDIPQGSGEQLRNAVMSEINNIVEKKYLALKAALKKEPYVEDGCQIRLKDKKRTKMVFYVYGDYDTEEAFVEFNKIDYSKVPDTFFDNELAPALQKWLQEKVDTNVYKGMFGEKVDFCLWVEPRDYCNKKIIQKKNN